MSTLPNNKKDNTTSDTMTTMSNVYQRVDTLLRRLEPIGAILYTLIFGWLICLTLSLALVATLGVCYYRPSVNNTNSRLRPLEIQWTTEQQDTGLIDAINSMRALTGKPPLNKDEERQAVERDHRERARNGDKRYTP